MLAPLREAEAGPVLAAALRGAVTDNGFIPFTIQQLNQGLEGLDHIQKISGKIQPAGAAVPGILPGRQGYTADIDASHNDGFCIWQCQFRISPLVLT